MIDRPAFDRAALARLDPLAVRRLLRDEGLRARHALSQNFLADPEVLESILAEAAVGAADRVLEIGPGLGILTGALLARGGAVTAVELDRRLAVLLRDRFEDVLVTSLRARPGAGQLRLIEGDALDQDLPSLVAPPYRVVANLPYHITSPILHRLLERGPRPERMVLMVQREVAERLAAATGRMSYLSVFVQYHAEVRVARHVPAAAFEPAPAVESAIIVVEPRRPGSGTVSGDPAVDVAHEAAGAAATVAAATVAAAAGAAAIVAAATVADEQALWALVQAGFRERRKMVHNVLVRQLGLPAVRVDAALAAVGIDRDRRPQTLSVADWIALRAALDEATPRG